jgi:hypothetical protein
MLFQVQQLLQEQRQVYLRFQLQRCECCFSLNVCVELFNIHLVICSQSNVIELYANGFKKLTDARLK